MSKATRVNVASSHWNGSQLQELGASLVEGPAAKGGGQEQPHALSQRGLTAGSCLGGE